MATSDVARSGPGPGPSSSSASTTPVPAPATSYSSGAEQPGVLGGLAADQGAAGQPAALGDARDDRGDPLGDDLADRDVVGHEQRLGAADHEVVDDHADQVDADRVVHVHPLGDVDLGADAVGGGGEQRAVGSVLSAEASKRPANPPRPPTTSGRCALATDSFISSTARSPASMSTPAAAYVVADRRRGPGQDGRARCSRRSRAAERLGRRRRRRRARASPSTSSTGARARLEQLLAEQLGLGQLDRVDAVEAGAAQAGPWAASSPRPAPSSEM